MKVSFKTKLPELAKEHGHSASDVSYLAKISINTAKSWMFGRVIAQINGDVTAKLMRLYGLDSWHELFEPVMYDAFTDQLFDPDDATVIIE